MQRLLAPSQTITRYKKYVALAAALTLVSFQMLAFTPPAQAGLFDVFELDGNAVDETANGPDDTGNILADFETVYLDWRDSTSNSGAQGFTFVADTGAVARDY